MLRPDEQKSGITGRDSDWTIELKACECQEDLQRNDLTAHRDGGTRVVLAGYTYDKDQKGLRGDE